MTTIYTHKLAKEGQGFNQFVMGCARAMDPYIDTHDEPLNKRTELEGCLAELEVYLAEELNRSKKELDELTAMNKEQIDLYNQNANNKNLLNLQKSLQSKNKENVRLSDMKEKVESWTPPTEDHEELKAFMLEQISISMSDVSYYEEGISEILNKPMADYRQAKIDSLESTIARCDDSTSKTDEDLASQFKWVEDLRESLRKADLR